MRTAKELAGIFPPAVTPFREDRPDCAALRGNLRRLSKSGIAGYLALGSNGEFRSLAERETDEILTAFAEEKGDRLLMIGTGSDSTAVTIDNCRRAADFGADFVSVITPSYFARFITDDVLLRYFRAVADASPVPVLIYNIPGFAGGVQISPAAVVELARHPNIAGMKDSSSAGPARYLTALAAEGRSDFAVLSGSTNTCYPALHLGAAGGILSLANIIPEACVELYALFTKGAYAGANALHQRLMRLNQAVSGKFGVAGVKAAMDLAGYSGGEPRHPLVPLNDAERRQIETSFIQNGLPLKGAEQ